MPLPYNLQKLPPEALDVLRFMGKAQGPVTSNNIETGARMSTRLVGKAIRRLINAGHIQLSGTGYQLTGDGKIAVQQLAENDKGQGEVQSSVNILPVFTRRLMAVMPHRIAAGRATEVYFGVNPPDATRPSSNRSARIELRLSAVGGSFSVPSLVLDIPADKAAIPGKVGLTPLEVDKPIRVRVDVFQPSGNGAETLGGMYFDVEVVQNTAPQEGTTRAVGMDLTLKSQ